MSILLLALVNLLPLGAIAVLGQPLLLLLALIAMKIATDLYLHQKEQRAAAAR